MNSRDGSTSRDQLPDRDPSRPEIALHSLQNANIHVRCIRVGQLDETRSDNHHSRLWLRLATVEYMPLIRDFLVFLAT